MLFADTPRRTQANAAIIEGFFGLMWFGWGQEGPPAWAWIVLIVGAVLAVLVRIGGIMTVRRTRGEPSPLSGPGARKRYKIIVATEVGLCGLGAAILGATGHCEFIAAWVCLVVGVHFLPLARVFPQIGMMGLAVAVSVVSLAAFAVGATTSVPRAPTPGSAPVLACSGTAHRCWVGLLARWVRHDGAAG
ncbi:MAG: hypothetical protein ACR2KG_00365 [Nocardioidaceae bacterium]